MLGNAERLTVSEKYKNRGYKSFKKADTRQQDMKKSSRVGSI
jgi:hypothetical protein